VRGTEFGDVKNFVCRVNYKYDFIYIYFNSFKPNILKRIYTMSFHSVFNTVIYLNLVIVCASSLLIGFFYFKPSEKRRVRLLVGVISIIFGCVMVIISLFGILSFNLYLEVLNSEGTPASVFNLNIIFMAFILVGLGLIVHGILKIIN
jgi:hypothetical protein